MLRQTYSSNLALTPEDVKIRTFGPCKIPNPQVQAKNKFELTDIGILINPFLESNGDINSKIAFDIAGPTNEIYFDPQKTVAGIVTCGGICPGLNNVIRAITLSLVYTYGCTEIYGFKYGLQGFIKTYNHEVIKLDPKVVSNIHEQGGTILGTSRGPQDIKKIVDRLVELKINQLYFIGGDGSLKAAQAINSEIESRNLEIAIVGIPKTIDNDISFASETFGFDTAVTEATKAIRGAHVEARAHPNGIGLVKLMGRNAGFIAAIASLSQRDVNIVLIPEQPFELAGKKGLLNYLQERLAKRNHAVIVVAEGAGQDLLHLESSKTDASGNKKLMDVGLFLRDKINEHFSNQKIEVNLKYIDPSYMIRSVNSNTHDDLFAAVLGQNSVHALMSGRTNLMVSMWHGVYCYVPLVLVTSRIKRLSLNGRIWLSVLETTGQPNFINNG